MVYGTYNYTYWCLKTNKHTWGGPTLQFPSMEGLQHLRRLSRSGKKKTKRFYGMAMIHGVHRHL